MDKLTNSHPGILLRLEEKFGVLLDNSDFHLHVLACVGIRGALRLLEEDSEDALVVGDELNHVVSVVVDQESVSDVEVARLEFLVKREGAEESGVVGVGALLLEHTSII